MIALKTPVIDLSSLRTADVTVDKDQVIEPVVTLTESAEKQIARALIKFQRDSPHAFLRIGVRGGGCSGLSYVLEPDTQTDDRDLTWVTSLGVRVVIDRKSVEFMSGTVIDYNLKNLLEGGFVYSNPHAAKSCGCGTSFTPA